MVAGGSQRKLAKANALFRAGDYAGAVSLYRQVIADQPEVAIFAQKNLELAQNRLKREQKPKNHNLRQKTYPAEAEKYLLSHEIYTVDIVIPVFNALAEVQACLKSVVEHSKPYDIEIIVVNDGSDAETSYWLERFAADSEQCRLINNPQNLGYTKSVNVGFRAARADYVVALNSDTIVTPRWIQSLLRCARSAPRIGIVGPLSNAASWQSVPDLYDSNNQFAVNEIPQGFTLEAFSELVSGASARSYPQVPFVNGFCFMVSRAVIDEIGFFDEQAFPAGYGEENDYCIRAAKAGFTLAIADDCYVYHVKSASFGHEKRKELAKAGSMALKEKYGRHYVEEAAAAIRASSALDDIRVRVRNSLPLKAAGEKSIRARKNIPSILFLLPVSGGGGGVHSIVQECMGMQALGVDARIAVPKKHVEKYFAVYADIDSREKLFLPFETSELAEVCADYDVVIATIYTSVKLLAKVCQSNPHTMPGYYVQDYEPLFESPGSAAWKEARDSYDLIPGCRLFAKTQWLCEKVQDEHGLFVSKVCPSIDHSVYYPDFKALGRSSTVAHRVSAMIRPKTPRRGAYRTMAALRAIKEKFKEDVEIHVFGCDPRDAFFNNSQWSFEYSSHGVLSRPGVAEVLRTSTFFLDLSDYQAFGRTGLEAAASGCSVIITCWGGASEYATLESAKTIHMVDVFSPRLNEELIGIILQNSGRHEGSIGSAMIAQEFSIRKAVLSELNAFVIGAIKHV